MVVKLHILQTSELVGVEWSISCSDCFTPGEKVVPSDRKLCGPLNWCREKSMSLPGIKHPAFKVHSQSFNQTTYPEAQHYLISVLIATSSFHVFAEDTCHER
jgi:hypothetical protein